MTVSLAFAMKTAQAACILPKSAILWRAGTRRAPLAPLARLLLRGVEIAQRAVFRIARGRQALLRGQDFAV